MSRNTFPSAEVTTPTVCGNGGSGRLRPASNRPSAYQLIGTFGVIGGKAAFNADRVADNRFFDQRRTAVRKTDRRKQRRRPAVFEGKVPVTRRRFGERRHFAFHRYPSDVSFQQRLDARRNLPDRKNRLFLRKQTAFHAPIITERTGKFNRANTRKRKETVGIYSVSPLLL